MSKTRDDIIWLADILEGEGYFYFGDNCPIIGVGMCDKDIIERVAKMFKTKIYVGKPRSPLHNICYTVRVCGEKAVGIMLSIYSLMGQRRKAKIKEIIEKWKSIVPKHKKTHFRQRELIREDYNSGKLTVKELAEKHNLKISLIQSICYRKRPVQRWSEGK